MADLTGDTLTLTNLTAEEHGAALYVCAIARDLDEARLLLDALGLNGRRMNSSGQWKWPSEGDECRNGHQSPPRYRNGSCKICTANRNAVRAARRQAARA